MWVLNPPAPCRCNGRSQAALGRGCAEDSESADVEPPQWPVLGRIEIRPSQGFRIRRRRAAAKAEMGPLWGEAVLKIPNPPILSRCQGQSKTAF